MIRTEIRQATYTDLERVVQIHRQAFLNSRSTRLGKPYLRKMYRWFLENQPGLFILVEQDGNVAGFVCGAIGGYGRKIFRYALPEIIAGFLLQPALILKAGMFTLWHSYLQAFNPFANLQPPPTAAPVKVKASLASIAVAREAQGRGIGRKLIQAFEQAAKERNANYTALSVAADNMAARKLYESCGWRHEPEYSGPKSAYYIKRLSPRDDA